MSGCSLSTLKGRSWKEARVMEDPEFTLQLIRTPQGNFRVIDTAVIDVDPEEMLSMVMTK